MAQVDANADIYASKRLGIFFKGIIPSLDGQCVSLVKWFMQEMSSVTDPQKPRGDARYVGQALVNDGQAAEVAYSQRRRGDIICYEYGTYGHIGVVLSGNRTFEENVNWPGVPAKVVDGSTVYASRIGSLDETWRTGKNPHVYRLKTYREGTVSITNQQLHDMGTALARTGVHREPKDGLDAHNLGKLFLDSTGKLTPATVIKALNHVRTSSSGEWQAQDAKLKS